MAGIFTKRIWQPCICQPNELKREIRKKLGGPNGGPCKNLGRAMAHPASPLESPLYMCFVDLEKAYHRVPREKLLGVLWEYSVDGRLLLTVK